MTASLRILAAISVGELIDRITILELKLTRLTSPAQREHVAAELACLRATRAEHVPASDELDRLTVELTTVNTALWDIEDALRNCERQQDFGEQFIQLARSVYFQNDRRAALKREINLLLGSAIVEEKSYADYGPSGQLP